MFYTILLVTLAVLAPSTSSAPQTGITYTGAVISSDGPLPVHVSAAVPKGRPVYTHTPQVTEHRRQQKTVHSKYNVAVPKPVIRKKVVQDVHHKYVAKPYAVPKPYAVIQRVPAPQPYPVYHHEVEVQPPVQVVRHHSHARRVQHFPLVKTADVVHMAQPAVLHAAPTAFHVAPASLQAAPAAVQSVPVVLPVSAPAAVISSY